MRKKLSENAIKGELFPSGKSRAVATLNKNGGSGEKAKQVQSSLQVKYSTSLKVTPNWKKSETHRH